MPVLSESVLPRVGLLIGCTSYDDVDGRDAGLNADFQAWAAEMNAKLGSERFVSLTLNSASDVSAQVRTAIAALSDIIRMGMAADPTWDPDVLMVVVGLGTQVTAKVTWTDPLHPTQKKVVSVQRPALAIGAEATLVLGPASMAGSLAALLDEGLGLNGSRRAVTAVIDCAFAESAPLAPMTRSLPGAPKDGVLCTFGPYDTVIGGGAASAADPTKPDSSDRPLVPIDGRASLTQVLLMHDSVGVELNGDGMGGFRLFEYLRAGKANRTVLVVGGAPLVVGNNTWAADKEYWQEGFPTESFTLVLVPGATPPATIPNVAAMTNRVFAPTAGPVNEGVAFRLKRSGNDIGYVRGDGVAWYVDPDVLPNEDRLEVTSGAPLVFERVNPSPGSDPMRPLLPE